MLHAEKPIKVKRGGGIKNRRGEGRPVRGRERREKRKRKRE